MKLLLIFGELDYVRYVYIIRSVGRPEQRYFGITSNLRQRLSYHNQGQCKHTSKFCPWRVETYIGFSDNRQAVAFEKYLKTGSGKAFSKKRL
jgi:putative endonuclease